MYDNWVATPKYKESIVRDLLTELLISKGFKRVRSTWRRETDVAYQLANIQRSKYGPHFFLNFAIVFKEIKPGFVPHRAFGHLQFRAGDLPTGQWDTNPTFKGEVHRILDEDEDFSTDERRNFVNGILWQQAERIFETFNDIDAARKHTELPFEQRIVPRVHRELLVYFGIAVPRPNDE